jgi:hypothetical protein
MAGIPITITGQLFDQAGNSQPVTLIGNASIVGLTVGGGPIIPPDAGSPPQPAHPIFIPPQPAHPIVLPPDGGSGGPPGTPTFPIWGPPGVEFPPGSGYPPVAGHPLPEPPTEGATPIFNWHAQVVWSPPTGWAVILVPGEGALVPTPSKK